MTTDKATGSYLARLREEAGLKQKELADKITWSATLLSRVESGERTVSPDELERILLAIDTKEAQAFQEAIRRTWKCLPRPPLGHPHEPLLWNAELALREIGTLLEEPGIKKSSASLLDNLRAEIHRFARLVAGTEYSLALVGDIGVGKSTAICRVSGLEVQDVNKGVPTPVLEVGGGGVTVCEVHLVRGPEYGLIVEPMGEQQIESEVREFASLIKNPPAPADDDTGDAAFGTSRELERAIRNMSGLTKQRRTEQGSDGRNVRRVTDPVKTLAERSTDTSTLTIEIVARMSLDSRTRRKLWYSPQTTNKDALGWLRENFELINNGRHPDFSIPRRVEMVVPYPVLGETSSSIRLIDTKGIDRTAERADLENLFSDPNTVVVMCSNFPSIPSPSVQQLLKRVRDGGSVDMGHKGIVLGLPRYDEALAVKDDEGFAAESVEEGYELKCDEAQTALQSMGLPNLRVEFFNAMADAPDDLRKLLIDLTHGLRQQHRSELQGVLKDARSLIDNFEQEQVLEVQRTAARHLQTWIENNRTLDFSSLVGPERSLITAMNSAHPSSLRASVRREGEWYNLDYSHQLSYGARRTAHQLTKAKIEDFRAVVDNLLQNSDLEEASGLLRHARRIVDAGVDNLFKRCRLLGRRIYSRRMKRSPALWRNSDQEWGRGPGYRNRVVSHHENWFNEDKRDFTELIEHLIQKEWEGCLDGLRDILEIS